MPFLLILPLALPLWIIAIYPFAGLMFDLLSTYIGAKRWPNYFPHVEQNPKILTLVERYGPKGVFVAPFLWSFRGNLLNFGCMGILWMQLGFHNALQLTLMELSPTLRKKQEELVEP